MCGALSPPPIFVSAAITGSASTYVLWRLWLITFICKTPAVTPSHSTDQLFILQMIGSTRSEPSCSLNPIRKGTCLKPRNCSWVTSGEIGVTNSRRKATRPVQFRERVGHRKLLRNAYCWMKRPSPLLHVLLLLLCAVVAGFAHHLLGVARLKGLMCERGGGRAERGDVRGRVGGQLNTTVLFLLLPRPTPEQSWSSLWTKQGSWQHNALASTAGKPTQAFLPGTSWHLPGQAKPLPPSQTPPPPFFPPHLPLGYDALDDVARRQVRGRRQLAVDAQRHGHRIPLLWACAGTCVGVVRIGLRMR